MEASTAGFSPRGYFDRESADETRKLVERILPDPDLRLAVLRILAESIEAAHAAGPGSWYPYVGINGAFVTNKVGLLWGLTVKREWASLLYVPELLPVGVHEELKRLDPKRADAKYVHLAPEILVEYWPRLREANLDAVRSAAHETRNVPNKKGHSPGLLAYLRQALGANVPNPEFSVPEPRTVAERLVAGVRKRYPSWTGFDHPEFTRDEITDKRKAVGEARQLLSREELGDLINRGDVAGVWERLERTTRLTNLLTPGVPSTGDAALLHAPRLDKSELAKRAFDLLYGEGDAPDRLERFSAWADGTDLPNKWTLPTYLLFLCHPETEILVKPRIARLLLLHSSATYQLSPAPMAKMYRRFRDLVLSLQAPLARYGAKDMIDLQSLIWVALGSEKEETETRKEKPAAGNEGQLEIEETDEPVDPATNPEASEPEASAFTPEAFRLLGRLHETPRRETYIEDRDLFAAEVEEPFQRLFRAVADQLPPAVLEAMESQKRVFAQILKNEYGQGGAWPFYWGALYPRGGRRVEDAQLFLWINHAGLEAGFAIGIYGSEQGQRFVRNCRRLGRSLVQGLNPALAAHPLVLGTREEDRVSANALGTGAAPTLDTWLANPDQAGTTARCVLSAREVLGMPFDELARKLSEVLKDLFPLALLAMHEDPLPAIAAYLGEGDDCGEPDVQPTYTVAQCAEKTGVDAKIIERWLRALERKGQAILYGPPGTGKTYMAERLARLVVSGGDGFVDIVQFHPAYVYEDFIQGIRPSPGEGSAMSFELAKGRFLEFAQRAGRVKDRCVLIIDEINRADLSRVFGELMFLLEYRDREVPLAAGTRFSIPRNVRLVGTMNTADRSIALVDHALRRRFAFLKLQPDYNVLRRFHEREQTGFPSDALVRVLQQLNEAIDDPNYEVGISFFLLRDLSQHLEDIWRMEIEPYLEERFFDNSEHVEEFRWDRIRNRLQP